LRQQFKVISLQRKMLKHFFWIGLEMRQKLGYTPKVVLPLIISLLFPYLE